MLLGLLINYIPDLPPEDYKVSVGNVYIPYVHGYTPDELPPNTRVEPYDIKGVEGFNAPDSNVAFSTAGQDGGVHLTSTVEQREVVLYLGFDTYLQEKGSVTSGRTFLYSVFPTNGHISMTIYTSHMPPVELSGFVESHQSNIFSNEPLSQIVIVCKDPKMYALEDVVIESEILDQNAQNIAVDYKGTWGSGFGLDLKFNSSFSPEHIDFLTVGLGVGGPSEGSVDPRVFRSRFYRAMIRGPFSRLPNSPLSIRYDSRAQRKGFYYLDSHDEESIHSMNDYIVNFNNQGLSIPPYWIEINSMVRRVRFWTGWPDTAGIPSGVNVSAKLTYREAYVGI